MLYLIASAFLGLFAAVAQAGTIVVPNDLAGVEGNYDNCIPFSSNCLHSSLRDQQVYAASQFGSGGLITQIAFRPDFNLGGAFSSTIDNIRIDLSTTSRAPNELSTTFASNVGTDDTIVFNGPLTLSSSFTGPDVGPKAFDIVINLTTPFLYSPGLGNLLLDVRNSSVVFFPEFDAVYGDGNTSVSRIFTGDVNAASGTTDLLPDGLVTQFTIVPEPEPGTFGLLAIGALALAGRRLRQG
jgi:hypothetical protein